MKLLQLCLGVLWLGLATSLSAAQPAANPPNVVIIFCDDLGYADIGPFGAQGYKTPALDRLAAEGRVFRNFHAAQAVCSASRAGLLTGCYPNRIGIHGALGPRSTTGISSNETTIAEMLKPLGYNTAIIGKWHLGDHPLCLPRQHGFDYYFGLPYSNDMWPEHPDLVKFPPNDERRKRGYPNLPLFENDQVINPQVTAADQAQLTTQYTEHAVQFIEQNRSCPFLLYLAHSMPHVPLFVSDKFRGRSSRGVFGDVIQEIDWSVGQVLEALRKLDLERNTLVIFTSDNGPWLSYGEHAGSASPLREGKGTSWEGGTRVPCIMRWPGKIPAGSESRAMLMTIDVLPTVAALTGALLPSHDIDGRNVWPLISGTGKKNPHPAYWIFYEVNQLQAVISGDGRWKLVLPHQYRTLAGRPGGADGKPVAYEQRKVESPELYDLAKDPGESRDVASQNPRVVRRLLAEAERARVELGRGPNQPGTGTRAPFKAPQQSGTPSVSALNFFAISSITQFKSDPILILESVL